MSLTADVTAAYDVEAADVLDLGGELDRNLKLTATDGSTYVLKLAGPHATIDSLELENSLLDALEDAGITAPRVLRARGGESITLIDGRHARLLTWVQGTVLGELEFRSRALLEELGATAARVALALEDVGQPALHRTHYWDLRVSDQSVRTALPALSDARQRELVEHMLQRWDAEVAGRLEGLPTQPVHQDLSDYNVVVEQQPDGWHITGVLDVGDALVGLRVAELAVTIAYAALRQHDPLAVAAAVARGFCAVQPLTETELELVYPLACVRLATNAATWTKRRVEDPGNERYADLRSRYSWAAVEQMSQVAPALARATIRAAGGLAPRESSAAAAAVARHPAVAPLKVDGVCDFSAASSHWEDSAVGEGVLATRAGQSDLRRAGLRLSGPDEPRTIATGSSVLCPVGTQVVAPYDGQVAIGADIVLTHVLDGVELTTTYRGLAASAELGDTVVAGQLIGTSVEPEVWLQVTLDRHTAVPEFVRPSEGAAWLSLCLDPAEVLLGLGPAPKALTVEEILRLRDDRTGRSQRSYYDTPPNLVRAHGVWFTDEHALNYLDAVNNVTHVGHGHPRIVEAARRQMMRLNTNSRFVYEQFARYAERLTALLPEPLEVVFFVCSGSEANDLAMRIAQTATGRTDTVVISGAYHGNTIAVTGISPHRYNGAGGRGAPPTTHEIPQPNRYRGEFGYDDADAGLSYAARAATVIDGMTAPPAALIAESLMGTAGQIIHPDGYLKAIFDKTRSVGGLCISDEVQVGFGRLGTSYWGFQDHGVVPDIVTMGKPMGNGHPLAAVVTTRAIAEAFDNGMRYFNTFGGNPVSCAVGMAVLDVIEEEGLQAKAGLVGKHLLSRLQELQSKHEIVGDVRGHGLYVGVELVRDRETKQPATREAYAISERMKDEGVFTYPNGGLENILKLKPPMVFGVDHADIFADTLDRILTEGW